MGHAMTNIHRAVVMCAALLLAWPAAPSLARPDAAQASLPGLSCTDQMDTEPVTDEGDVIPVSAPACDVATVPVAI